MSLPPPPEYTEEERGRPLRFPPDLPPLPQRFPGVPALPPRPLTEDELDEILPPPEFLEFPEVPAGPAGPEPEPEPNLFSNIDLLQNISGYSDYRTIINLCKSDRRIEQYCRSNPEIRTSLLRTRPAYISMLTDRVLQKYELEDIPEGEVFLELEAHKRSQRNLRRHLRNNRPLFRQVAQLQGRLRNIQRSLAQNPTRQSLLDSQRDILQQLQNLYNVIPPRPSISTGPVLQLIENLLFKGHNLIAGEMLRRYPEAVGFAFMYSLGIGNFKMIDTLFESFFLDPKFPAKRVLVEFIEYDEVELLDRLLRSVDLTEYGAAAIQAAISVRNVRALRRLLQEPGIRNSMTPEEIAELALGTGDPQFIKSVYAMLPESSKLDYGTMAVRLLEAGDVEGFNRLRGRPELSKGRLSLVAVRRGLIEVLDRLLADPESVQALSDPDTEFSYDLLAEALGNVTALEYLLRHPLVKMHQEDWFKLLEMAVRIRARQAFERLLRDPRVDPSYFYNRLLKRLMQEGSGALRLMIPEERLWFARRLLEHPKVLRLLSQDERESYVRIARAASPG